MWPGLSVLTRMRLGPSSQAMLRAICKTADLDVLYDTHAWSCRHRARQHEQISERDASTRAVGARRAGPSNTIARSLAAERGTQRTLFVILPLMLATRTILPPFPNRAIWRPAACAVNSTPFTLTSMTCVTRQ